MSSMTSSDGCKLSSSNAPKYGSPSNLGNLLNSSDWRQPIERLFRECVDDSLLKNALTMPRGMFEFDPTNKTAIDTKAPWRKRESKSGRVRPFVLRLMAEDLEVPHWFRARAAAVAVAACVARNGGDGARGCVAVDVVGCSREAFACGSSNA